MANRDPPARRYCVTIPYNVAEGQRFEVVVENKPVLNIRPYGAAPGSELEISAVGGAGSREAVPYYRIPDYGSCGVGRQWVPFYSGSELTYCDIVCILICDVIVFVLLLLVRNLNPFATQYLSSSCNAINPRTGELMSKAYFNLWRGYGNTPDCIDSGADFW
jgi:hypothetical protein